MKTTRMSAEAVENSKTRTASVDDRRVYDRLPPQFESVEVRTRSGEIIPAKVDNVSLGGIGLRLESSEGIAARDRVEVIYLYVAMPATVRHVVEREDGSIVAGLEWSKSPVA